MPDESPEQKASREAEEKRQQELDARIVAGVTAGLKPVIEKLSERERSEPVVTRPSEPATIQRPTEEQLADALIDGNKAEYARLLKLERAATTQENQRALANISAQGTAAFDSVSRSQAESDPTYKRYKPEIEKELNQFRATYPGQPLTPEHYRIATEIVRSRHIDEIVNERVEESRRQAREQEEALLPENQHHEEHKDKDPTTLKEALDVPDWKLYQERHRMSGRSDEEELRLMNRKLGFRDEGGLAKLIAQRKQNAKIEEEVGSGMGLDHDWDKTKGEWIN